MTLDTAIETATSEVGPDAGVATLRCTARRTEAPGVETFTLRPETGWARHATGQCLTLLWDGPDGTPRPRSFTIASPATRGPEVEITVRRSRSGATADMHQRLTPGTAVAARGPAGGFGPMHDGADGPLLLIGAGSGATPLMAALRHLCDEGQRWRDVVYLHAAAVPDALLFRAELEGMARAMPGLTVMLLPSRVPEGVAWTGPRGRLTRRLLQALVPDAAARDGYLCGPPAFMEATRLALRASGARPAQIRLERFHPEAEASEADAPATTARVGTARLLRSGREVALMAGAPLSRSLAAAGVVVPTGCRQGLCGTCRLRVTGGALDSRDRGGLTEAERAAGYALACASLPTGDLELDL